MKQQLKKTIPPESIAVMQLSGMDQVHLDKYAPVSSSMDGASAIFEVY
jgi:hypothetical protein